MTTRPAAGEIFDIGYRRYDGPRLGRGQAVATLFWSSLRATFGLGRSARSKIVPWGLTALALLPAGVAVAIKALIGDAIQPFTYDNYLFSISAAFGLFVAAQAPELVGGDQRHRVLALYFSHPISRLDYAAAKLGALATALFLIALVPQLLLFAGRVLASADVISALGDEIGALVQIVGSSLLYSITLGSIGLAIAAFTPRRAYATAAIIAVLLISGAVSALLIEVGSGVLADVAPLLDVYVVLDGVRDWLFGGTNADSPLARTTLPLPVFGAVAAGIVAISLGALVLRYRRIAA